MVVFDFLLKRDKKIINYKLLCILIGGVVFSVWVVGLGALNVIIFAFELKGKCGCILKGGECGVGIIVFYIVFIAILTQYHIISCKIVKYYFLF
ncbi:hypothetical protein PAUR_a2178 [Pseudoalteromonas aurantia 208]|uniref:Vitamin K epoxide reductase domain-containing protein n=1 Tax=Pseudoalteromonas aurantia 208 TaxID=1314867 RepID=A0ABR9ECQ9_9GAMM|nr:hypothetical protein [Pseudoalteromonas aurantia 208]